MNLTRSDHDEEVETDATDVPDIKVLDVYTSLEHLSELLGEREWDLPYNKPREEVGHLLKYIYSINTH